MENPVKKFVPLAFASALLMSACTDSAEDQQDVQASVYNYKCESGEMISVTYPSADSAAVTYKGKTHKMEIAVSGSGSRYFGDGLEWASKGVGPKSEGILAHHMADGTSGESIEMCTGL